MHNDSVQKMKQMKSKVPVLLQLRRMCQENKFVAIANLAVPMKHP